MAPEPAEHAVPQQRCEIPSDNDKPSPFSGVRAAAVALLAAAAGFAGWSQVSSSSDMAAMTSREMTELAPTGLNFSGRLPDAPRQHWDWRHGAIEDIVKNGAPVVLQGLSTAHMPAIGKWKCSSDEFLASVNNKKDKLRVKMNRVSNGFIYRDDEHDNYMSDHFVKKHYDMWTHKKMSGEELMDSVCTRRSLLGKANYTYFDGKIEEHFPELLADIKRACLVQLPSQFSACTKQNAAIWMGSPGMVTQAHFDRTHNLFVQIEGYKQFILFPPNATVHFHPSGLHPSSRQSQVDNFAQIFSLSSSEFPKVNHSALEEASVRFPRVPAAIDAASTALLGPGDVLYLPGYWNHLVFSLGSALGTERVSGERSLTGSISYNAWFSEDTTDLEKQLEESVIKGLDMIGKSMAGTAHRAVTEPRMIAIAREFLAQVSSQMGYPEFAQVHFDDRYAPLVHPDTVEVLDNVTFCAPFEGDPSKAEIAGAEVVKVLKQFPAEKRVNELGDLYDFVARKFFDMKVLSKDSEVRPSSACIQFMKAMSACGPTFRASSRQSKRRRRRQRKSPAGKS
jgi:hypothetical protein